MSARPDTTVASPCIDVCRMDPGSGWCLGCARSLDEIAAWGGLADDGKRGVLAQLPARQLLLQRMTGPGPAREPSVDKA